MLNLDGTPLTDAGLDHLARCPGLTTLNLTMTKVTAAGLARFHTAVPGCRVTHDGGVIEPRK